MSTLVGNDRLAELLAGSTAILTNSSGTTTDAPMTTSQPGRDQTEMPADATPAQSQDAASPVATLAPATSLLSDTVGTDAGNVAGLGNVLNLGQGAASPLQLAGSGGTVQPVLNAVNAEINDFHSAQLEVLSDELGAPDIVHAVTNTGKTIGLGAISAATPGTDGHTNLLTDVLNAPSTLLNGGGLGSVVAQVGDDLTDVVHAANNIVDAVLSGNDVLNPVPELIQGVGSALHDLPLLNGGIAGDGGLLGGIVGDLGDSAGQPAGIGGLVDGVLGGTGTASPLSGLLSGLGGGPLLTLNGGNNANDGSVIGGIVGDRGGSSSGQLINADVGPEQSSGGLVANLLSQPDAGPHHAIEINGIDVGPNGPQLADLGLLTGGDGLNLPVLGSTGTGNLVDGLLGGPDGLNALSGLLPGLGGDTHSPLLTLNGGNNANDGGVIGGIVGDLGGSSSGHLIDADVGPEQSSGGLVADLLSQPEAGPHHAIEVNGIDVGPNGPQLADLGLLTGSNGLNLPVLNGTGGGTIVDGVLGSTDAANPLSDLLSGLGDAQHSPLLTLNGGNNANDGGVIGGIVGDFAGSSTGHLIDADVGPQQSSGGLVADLLSQPQAGPHNAVDVNAIDVGAAGPHLADLGLLTGADGLHVPALNGTGVDGLVGNLLGSGGLLGTGSILSGNTTTVPVTAPVNIDLVHDIAPLIGDHGILDLHGTHVI